MDKLSPEDIEKNTEVYNYVTYLGNPDFWFGTHKDDNYERLTRITDFTKIALKGAKCLDVGCGTGDLSRFLRKKGVSDYMGIDIYGQSLDSARKKYPDELFVKMDILQWDTNKKFDYVFCSGALSTKLTSDNYDFIESMIRKMWGLAAVGVSFNFITESLPWLDPTIFHYAADRIFAITREIIEPDGHILHRIVDGEAHVYIWKNQD